ncbi:MAG: aldo/keto reductase [Proteobacteria bacterium]|uniref:Aldo/keto reductase n=1 Tax=Candidatus Avisuccinivibrio stercorigallinarum TaxID=2840704 RepID=A0A9D9DAH2_9GAMM|nr:aldo/keto reductase [Candidatus Avisuccinivibrio stercorigallinarum]
MLNINSTVELNNGVKMPLLGLGVFRSAAGEETRSAVRCALENGYRHIDTARIYCNEKSVGRGIKDSGLKREDIFVTTKLWRADYANPRKGLTDSLARLGLDYIDLYLLHWPWQGFEKAWLTLEKLQQEGLCRAIGVSNFKEHHFAALKAAGAGVIPQVNQTECHPENAENELLGFCQQQGTAFEAYSPLGGQNALLVNDPRILVIAQEHQVSGAQVLLRWQLQRGVVVIPKSIKPERILSNAQLYHFELSSADMEAIGELNQNRRRAFDPDRIDARPRSLEPVIVEEE